MVAIFLFDGDRIACERVYFDALTMLNQLADRPMTPLL
jgi:hypothetical protein